MKKEIIFLILFSIFSSLKLVKADGLPPDMKQIQSFVKLEGWENVDDYLIVQPIYGNWNDCKDGSGGRNFYLLNSGHACKFGSESHCLSYYYPMAINKKYIGDINIDDDYKYSTEYSIYNSGFSFKVSCNSEAYKTAIPTKAEIPHTNNKLVSKNDPLEREDYIVTFDGVDLEKNELMMTVSEPIARYVGDEAEAQAFIDNLVKVQNLNNIEENLIPENAIEPTVLPSFVATAQPKLDKNIITKESDNEKIKTISLSWYVVAGLSLIIIGFVFGYVLGMRKNIMKVETPNDAQPDIQQPLSS